MTWEVHPSCVLEYLCSRFVPPPCHATRLPLCETCIAYPTLLGSWFFLSWTGVLILIMATCIFHHRQQRLPVPCVQRKSFKRRSMALSLGVKGRLSPLGAPKQSTWKVDQSITCISPPPRPSLYTSLSFSPPSRHLAWTLERE